MKFIVSSLSIVFTVLFLSGCTATQGEFHVNVDTIGMNKDTNTSYILLPGNKDVTVDDLQFKEYGAYVNRALKAQGYIQVNEGKDADIGIFLAYGVSDPERVQETYSVPVYGQTGVSSSYTTGTVSSYGSTGSYSGYTTYTPTYGITGSTTRTNTYTVYLRSMLLDAIDLNEYRKNKKQIQVWKTIASSSGSSGDLRKVFPYLVAASQEYIGVNTGEKVKVILYENDEKVVKIKGIDVSPNLAVENNDTAFQNTVNSFVDSMF